MNVSSIPSSDNVGVDAIRWSFVMPARACRLRYFRRDGAQTITELMSEDASTCASTPQSQTDQECLKLL